MAEGVLTEEVLTVTNPDNRLFQLFLFESMAKNPEAIVADNRITIPLIISRMHQGTMVAFVGFSGNTPQTLMLVSNHLNMPVQSVVYFYSTGDAHLRKLTIKIMVDWIKSSGYNSFRTVNSNVGTDEAFKRLFGHVGNIKELGTIFLFEV